MKKFFKWILWAFVALLVLGFIIESTKSPEEKAADAQNREMQKVADAQEKAERARAEADSLPTYTATDLVQAYEANTVSADQKFKGKKYKITGSVKDINTDFSGNPYLVLSASGGNPFMLPQFKFDKASAGALANLQKGSKVTLICTGRGDIAKTPMSGDCTLM